MITRVERSLARDCYEMGFISLTRAGMTARYVPPKGFAEGHMLVNGKMILIARRWKRHIYK